MLDVDSHGTWNATGWFVVTRPGARFDDWPIYAGPDESTAAEVAAWWEHRYGVRPDMERSR
jgi:hypothetical protein